MITASYARDIVYYYAPDAAFWSKWTPAMWKAKRFSLSEATQVVSYFHPTKQLSAESV